MTEELEAYDARVTCTMESKVRADCDSFVSATVNAPIQAFDGLTDVYQTCIQDLARLYELPVAVLYGNSPHESSGDEDMQAYYGRVERQMREYLFDPLERALANIKARAMRRRLHASRALKPGRNWGRRMK